MLKENKNYDINDILMELDAGLSNKFCKDCNNCALKLDNELTVVINNHKHHIWCYGILLTIISLEVQNAVF